MTTIAEQVIYEDNHLIVINKLPSQIVQGDKTGDTPLSEWVAAYLKEKYQKPGDAFIGVVHRLDRPVSGVVVFAKTSKALSRLNESFRDRDVQKTYWAIVRGIPAQAEGVLTHYLAKNEKQNKSYITQVPKGALHAELSYKIIAKAERYALLEVKPITGRHHQIRVQLASMQTPIAGDLKYGDKRSMEDGSICLHARSLEIMHPVQKERMKFVAPPPKTGFWHIFSEFEIND